MSIDSAISAIDDKVAKNKAIVLAALTCALTEHELSVFDRDWANVKAGMKVGQCNGVKLGQ